MASIFKPKLSGRTKCKIICSTSSIIAKAAYDSLSKNQKKALITSLITSAVLAVAAIIWYSNED